MSLKLNAAGLTNLGLVRGNNEDSIFYLAVDDVGGVPIGLFIVADGVGGHLAGEMASRWAVSAARDALRDLFAPRDTGQTQPLDPSRAPTRPLDPAAASSAETIRALAGYSLRDRVIHAVQAANRAVYDNAQRYPAEAGNAGTTMTLALVRDDRATIANIGDSRTYLLRGGDMIQITTDHSLIAGLVKSGSVTPEESYTHPVRSVIVRALGHATAVDVDVFEKRLQPGDGLLLCSDGLWEMLRGPARIAEIARRAATPIEACRELIDAANAAGGQDNISVIVVRVE